MIDSQLSLIWKETLALIKQDITKPNYDTWFKSTELVAYLGDIIIIRTPNEFAKNFLEGNFSLLINNRLEEILKCPLTIKFVTAQEENNVIKTICAEKGYDFKDFEPKEPQKPPQNPKEPEELKKSFNTAVVEETSANHFGLNAKYTFDTFVVGTSNRFAHAACQAVAENISKSVNNQKIYNPLFMYGGAGLGKTHLMHAIGNYIVTHNPKAKIKYVSSEKFTNEMIDGIKDGRTTAFRSKYRNVDVLLIDDIQFLSKKEGTQEEFFHTFNDLYEANKQIIISSDRQPKEIPTLEERLRTRFEWGLITDIQAPDFETRVAILRKKAEIDGLEVGSDVIAYIAENIQSNIRELEGVLVRLAAFSNLNHREINLELAQECLQNIIPTGAPVLITGELIQEKVAEVYSLKVDDLKAKKRTRSVAYPRQIAMYLCRELTDMSLPKIGEIFGGRDHTTVIHAHEKISEEIKKNNELSLTVERIKKNLNS